VLIQPVCIPNLEHTGIRSKFDEYTDPVMGRHGMMSVEFKATIQKQLK
jgi:hypothetical protein